MRSRTTVWRRQRRINKFIKEKMSEKTRLESYYDPEYFTLWNTCDFLCSLCIFRDEDFQSRDSISSNEIQSNNDDDELNTSYDEWVDYPANGESQSESIQSIQDNCASNNFHDKSNSDDDMEMFNLYVFILSLLESISYENNMINETDHIQNYNNTIDITCVQ